MLYDVIGPFEMSGLLSFAVQIVLSPVFILRYFYLIINLIIKIIILNHVSALQMNW